MGFKAVWIDSVTKQVVIGRRTKTGWVKDAVVSRAIEPTGDYNLSVRLVGLTVNVILNNQPLLSYAYNSLVTDGLFGLFSLNGNTSFDVLRLRANEPKN